VRGSRAPRGRAASAEDYAQQRARLRKEAAEVAERQRAAAAELRAAAPRLTEVRLSSGATGLLLDLIARSLAAASLGFTSSSGADNDLGINVTLTKEPGGRTLIRGADGDLMLDELRISIGATTPADLRIDQGVRQEAG
jgi:hypothetical protein